MGGCYITIYGGVREVGGTKILVESNDERFLLDFGKQHSSWLKYYEYPFSLPKTIDELIMLGLTPPPKGPLENIYTSFSKEDGDVDRELETGISACIFSHAHSDHVGHAFLLNRRIRLFFGEAAWEIVKARLDYSVKGSIEDLSFGFSLSNGNVNVFRSKTRISNLTSEITAFSVDHSVPGSYAFLIDLGDKRLAYTGDFRWHGPAGHLTSRFAERLRDFEADILICEGTQFSNINFLTEADVEREAKALVSSSRKLVVVNLSPLDIDRLHTFFKVAEACGRKLVLNVKLAAVLARLAKMRIESYPNLKDLLIYYPKRKRMMKWKKSFLSGAIGLPFDVRLSEREYALGSLYGGAVEAEDVLKNPGNYILVTSYYSYEDLVELYRCSKGGFRSSLEGGVYVMSTSEPFEEELEIKFEKLKNWIRILGMTYYPIHSSGHIRPLDLKRFLEYVKVKCVVPVHSEAPHFMISFVRDLNLKVVNPVRGRPIEF
ncbi:MAG: MBL fold metallo-hydrolase [archaeon GB-1867-005]|nr:MBL fold metallo-hydrolase [Candidatus Culexmicrobium cathedralense]